nr:hypothetical protein [Tanacetum cinerariifolium]
MAASGSLNLLAMRVIDDLLDFSGETFVAKSMKFFFLKHCRFLNLIHEVFNTLMCLRDDIRDENSKLEGLNDAIAEAEEKIAMKEEHAKTMEAASDHEVMIKVISYFIHFLSMAAFLILDKLAEVTGFPCLQDRMNLMFSGACSEDESFIGLIRNHCFGFWMMLNKNRRLIAELEALGQREDALRSLDYLREMVVRDYGTLKVLV